MGTLYDGRACQDPTPLFRACQEQGLPADWYGSANLFRVPQGRGPGDGKIILTLDDLNAIDLTTDHDLTFLDDQGNTRTLKKVTLLRGYCLTPGWEGDPAGTFLCEVVDRRWQLARIPVDKGYNIASADGTTYLTSSQNGGSPWTWQTLVQDLATTLGLGTVPALPFTYTANPENLTFFGGFAWEALNQVLDALGCTIKYDPVADTFAVLKLGDAAAAGATAAAAELAGLDRGAKRTWDGYWQEPDRGRLPEKVRVTFPRRPQPTDGTSIYYTVDVTLTPAAAGVQAGSYEQLHDGLTAVGSGTPTNAAALSTRANEVAARWRAKRVYSEARQTLVYRDFQDGPKLLCETTGAVAFDDRGGMMGTEVMSRPDGLWGRPWEQPLVLGEGGRFWAQITGGSDASGYSWKRKVQTSPGTWTDATSPTPLTGTNNAWRAPSNTTPPTIPTGQIVELVPSTAVTGYEIYAVGGIQTFTGTVVTAVSCSGSTLTVTTKTLSISGRDLTASLT